MASEIFEICLQSCLTVLKASSASLIALDSAAEHFLNFLEGILSNPSLRIPSE